jgi:hypothetical protein
MNIPMKQMALTLAAAALGVPAALAQHGAEPAQAETVTLDAQGHYPEWEHGPHMVEFYALSVEALRADAGRVDVADYERRSYTIFRAFAESLGVNPDGMVDHLKAIPREMVTIVARDPKVLDSYESFLVALRGPR